MKKKIINSYVYNYTFISSEIWTEPSYPNEVGSLCPITPFIEPSVSMDNYKNQFIIWITTFNAESSITRSCYLRLTLYGYRENPLQKPFNEPCNPVSIKPNDYKHSNIINCNYK